MILYSTILFSSQTGAGTSAVKSWPGGRGVLEATGTFAGSALTFETLGPDGTSWLQAVTPAGSVISLTAPGIAIFELPVAQIRAVLTGGAPVTVGVTAARVVT